MFSLFIYCLSLDLHHLNHPNDARTLFGFMVCFFLFFVIFFCLLICDIHNSVTSSPTTTIQHIIPTSHPIWPSPASKKCQQLVQSHLARDPPDHPPNCCPKHEARSVLSLHWKRTVPRKPSKTRRTRNSQGKEIEGGPQKSSWNHRGWLQSPL